jgi:AsmA protein
MEVRIAGRMGIGFAPGLVLTLQDVQFHSRGTQVASSKEATLRVDLLSLLGTGARIEKIVLKQPVIAIERDRDGRFNLGDAQDDAGSPAAMDWPDVSFSDATVVYTDNRFGKGFEARACSADVHGLRHAGGQRASRRLSFTAEVACGQFRKNDFTVSDLKFTAAAKDGVFDLKPLTTRAFGTQGSGSFRADFSGSVPAYLIVYTLTQFPIEEVFKNRSTAKVAAGRMDFSANLSTQGTSVKELRQAMKGQVSLRGKSLTLSGIDLDREFARFESSQTFNLVDVGALFFAGPLGLLVTKGYDFATISQSAGGSSEIQTLISDWKVEHGLAHAQDVAMATKANRIALQGGLDFVSDQFNDVTIALVDVKGCAKVRQKVRGTFQDPVVEKPDLLKTMTGPVRSLLKKGGDLILGDRCDVFYAGSLMASK